MPDRVLTLKQFAELTTLSLRTAKRVVEAGELPVAQLSARRIGLRSGDIAKWQAERTR
jgi:predicted DNA-binding transcriptional regulator AlpA